MWEFFAPDAQAGDAYGWLVNQTSHWALGVLLVWLGDRFTTRRRAALIAGAGFLAWEAAQIYAGGALADSAADAAFVALGAAWGARGGSWFGFGALAAGLILGVSARL